MKKHVRKHLIRLVVALYVMLMISLILSDYGYESYDQEMFNSARYPETIFLDWEE